MLWNQGLGRLFNPNFLHNDTTPLFFLHTALWAYLPFSPVFALELLRRGRDLLRHRRLPPDEARVLLWWFLVPFVAVSFARYRLPQYCYWMAPAAALISARALLSSALPVRPMLVTQVVLSSLVLALIAFLLFLCFPGPHFLVTESWLVLAAVVAASGRWMAQRVPAEVRPMAVGLFALTAFNVVFEGHLHRAILEYQPDQALGTLARELDPGGRALPRLGTVDSQALAFYARRDAVTMSADELRAAALAGKAPYAVVAEERIPELTASGELEATPLVVRPQFWTSRPTLPFLLRRSRPKVVANVALVELRPTPR
jgi:4-amino-4-deoxy-L-arabinose transferase-like glycosyltransferase